MTAESWNTGEATGWRRRWLIGYLSVSVIEVVVVLAIGRPTLSLAGAALAVGGTLRALSVRGKGVDPSKSTIQRVRKREFLKYGRPF